MNGIRQRRGFVYFVRHTNGIKIGFSSAPHNRISSLKQKPLYPIGIMAGTLHTERRVHKALAPHRLVGEREWFADNTEVRAYINSLSLQTFPQVSENKNIKLKPDVWQAVKVHAAELGKPMHELIDGILRAYLSKEISQLGRRARKAL